MVFVVFLHQDERFKFNPRRSSLAGKRQQRRDSILSQNTLLAVETPEAKLRHAGRGFGI